MKSRILVLSAFFSVALALSAATVAPDEAKSLYNSGNFSAAIPLLQQQYEKNNKNGAVTEMLAVSLFKTGKAGEARKYFDLASKHGISESLLYLAQYKFDDYDFDGAASLLDEYEAALKRTKKELPDMARKERAVIGKAKDMFDHVEKIVVIDSITVDKADFFKAYKISKESGTLADKSVLPFAKPANETSVFIPDDGDFMMWAAADSSGILRLMATYKLLDGTWDKAVKFDDILNDEGDANYPYMMPDGQTMYYANNGVNSIGGYDIFITSKDSETGEFLQPQNIGMPYNSPFDDYLLVIDENTGVGWWATDRNQIPGKLTIYVYIPSDTRVNYDAGFPHLKEVAALKNFRLTWPDSANYDSLLAKINAIDRTKSKSKSDFTFYVSKGVVYSTLDDFKTTEGRNLMEQYLSVVKTQNENKIKLQSLRAKFHSADKGSRQELTNQIVQAEKNVEKRNEEINYIANSIRKVENKK